MNKMMGWSEGASGREEGMAPTTNRTSPWFPPLVTLSGGGGGGVWPQSLFLTPPISFQMCVCIRYDTRR